jgi:hypothetical protein
MENRNKIFKILQTIFVFGFVIWLGGTALRTMVAYNLFQFGVTMELKPTYTNMERMNTIYLFSTTALLTGIAYGSAVASSILLAFMSKGIFKQKGWIFMAFILFIFTIPIQTYFFYLDYQLADTVYYREILDFYHPDVQKYFVQRYKNVTNASMRSLMLLAAFTCMLYLVWQPLDRKNNKHQIESENNDVKKTN